MPMGVEGQISPDLSPVSPSVCGQTNNPADLGSLKLQEVRF